MSAHPEELLISAVIRTGQYGTMAAAGITTDMFDAYREEAEWIGNYVTVYRKTPTKTAFKTAFPEFRLWATDDIEHYCDEVRQLHVRSRLVDMIDASLTQMDTDTDTAVRHLHAGLLKLVGKGKGLSKPYDVMSDWDQTFDVVSKRVQRVRDNGLAGIPTGFPTMDNITGGLQPGWFAVVAARLGQGKTWTGVRMGFTAAASGFPVMYFSLEQSRHQIAMRMHSFASRQYGKEVFNSLDLSRGHGFDLRAYKTFLSGLKANMGTGEFIVHDASRGSVSAMAIRSAVEARPDVALVIIDYITLMQGNDGWRELGKVSAELQGLAQTTNIPIVGLSQVSRLGQGKEPPGAEHLAQADAIGQDADLLLTMVQSSPHTMKMKVAKFRNGPGGATWYCHFSPGTGQFDEISRERADEIIEADNEVD